MKQKGGKADRIVTVHSKTRVRVHFLNPASDILATASIGKKKWAQFCFREIQKSGHSGMDGE